MAKLVVALLLVLAATAHARPGGGQTYSGGRSSASSSSSGYRSSSSSSSWSHSSGGSTNSGSLFDYGPPTPTVPIDIDPHRRYTDRPRPSSEPDDPNSLTNRILDPVGAALQWTIFHPYVLLPLLLLILWRAWRDPDRDYHWDSGDAAVLPPPAPSYSSMLRYDPDFSGIAFEDFAFRLFASTQRARANPETLATLAPYVAQKARDQLAKREPVGGAVLQVVVGSMHPVQMLLPDDPEGGRINIRLQLEANIATAEHTYYVVETWVFARNANVRSKPPKPGNTFPCPNCGAPWQASATGTQVCASCGETVDNGRFDWLVADTVLVSTDERGPSVTEDVPERGTDLPTVVSTAAAEHAGELADTDPIFARLDAIYHSLNAAWSKNELAGARAFVSDGLYDYLQYWIVTYKQQHVHNELVDMRITRTELADVSRDKYFDALTFRIWATGKDFVVDDNGRVVTGSKTVERAYSEYWTLVRTAGKQAKPQATAICNNCGAPLQIDEAGACGHCGAHVTSGEFDWVLSKIEQDDSYGDS